MMATNDDKKVNIEFELQVDTDNNPIQGEPRKVNSYSVGNQNNANHSINPNNNSYNDRYKNNNIPGTTAPGYSPRPSTLDDNKNGLGNRNVPRNNTKPSGDNGNDNSNNSEGSNENSQPPMDPRRDYPESPAPKNVPEEKKSDAASGDDNNHQVEKNAGVPNPTSNNEQVQNGEQSNGNNGLEKKNDLEDGNQDKKDSASTEPKKNEESNTDSNNERNDSQPSNTGNGYNPHFKENPKTQTGAGDDTVRARDNLDHSNRVAAGNNPQVANETGAAPQSGLEKLKQKITSKLPTKQNLFNKQNKETSIGGKDNDDAAKRTNNPFDMFGGNGKDLWKFLLKHPEILGIVGILIFVLFLIILIIVIFGEELDLTSGSVNPGGFNGDGVCKYELNGVLTNQTLTLEGVQVELINCDAKPDNYKVLEYVDFEKYVIGVALAEVGSGAHDETLKTQIIVARNFALTRNRAMCPSRPDNCFYGYNPNTGIIRVRACVNEQVYWDYEKDIYTELRPGKKSLYSPEVNSGKLWKAKLNETRKAEVLALAAEVRGKVYVDQNGDAVYTDFINTTQEHWASLAVKGYKYPEILEDSYGKGSIYNADCTNGSGTTSGTSSTGNYTMNSDNAQVLNQELAPFLASKGSSIDLFNNTLSSSIRKAGYATREGVIAAGVTLVGELANKYGVKIPYVLGGGHLSSVGGGISDLALGTWGGSCGRLCSLDCSGFVSWALWNGGFDLPGTNAHLASSFQRLPGVQKVSLSASQAVIQPGDILESSEHVVLVVGIDDASKQYICVEASGRFDGLQFSRRSFNEGGYWGLKMDGFYNNTADKRSS